MIRAKGSIYNPLNNRLVSNQSGLVDYDVAGNQTKYDSFTLVYNANNLMKSIAGSNGSNGAYFYDGADKRIKKILTPNGGTQTTTYYIYDALGRLAAEYSEQAVTNNGVSWIFADMLGSTRAIISESGSVTECYDYLPFGRILSSADNGRGSCHPSNPDNNVDGSIPQKFTGKERDAETGLDYFGARYYSGPQGRWTSPDRPFADQRAEDPQSWNLYSYVVNNPLNMVDPDGLTGIPPQLIPVIERYGPQAMAFVQRWGWRAWAAMQGWWQNINTSGIPRLVNGFIESNGFRYSQYYWNRLWTTGRPAPSFWAD
jgi:RHS repeat-associated protein